MKIVYLDQNKWIDLARAFHGKNSDPDLQRALRFAQDQARQGAVAFPLSGVHYMETAKIHDHDRRSRLGTVMWELSYGYTMATYRHIVCCELETALARRFPGVSPRTFKLLSKGVAHAFDMNYSYRVPEAFRSSLPAEIVESLENEAQAMLEKAAITGEGPGGIRTPSTGFTQYNHRFKEHLETLHPRIFQLPSEKWEDALHAMALVDIKDPMSQVLELHGLSWGQDLEPLGKDGLIALIEELPSRKVEVHLHRQILKNPQLKPRLNDLEDWSGLGPASAHCDVVVCEKHFANLVLRDEFRPKAQVITDVKELPELI